MSSEAIERWLGYSVIGKMKERIKDHSSPQLEWRCILKEYLKLMKGRAMVLRSSMPLREVFLDNLSIKITIREQESEKFSSILQFIFDIPYCDVVLILNFVAIHRSNTNRKFLLYEISKVKQLSCDE